MRPLQVIFHFDGKKDPERRRLAEAGLVVDLGEAQPIFPPYRKKALTYAIQIMFPFDVETLEGLHTGKPGDWLAIGTSGEMYPIDAAVFAESYTPAREA